MFKLMGKKILTILQPKCVFIGIKLFVLDLISSNCAHHFPSFENNVDPDQPASDSHLIRIYTIFIHSRNLNILIKSHTIS